MKNFFLIVIISILGVTAFAMSVSAQRRDHLTAEEVEIVRNVQDVDLRMEVFAHAIERRLWVLAGKETLNEEQSKRFRKDRKKWGDLPTGTRTELISDIEKILNEAINKLDDVFDREPKNELIPYAIHIIADFSEALIPKLVALAEGNESTRQIGLIETAAVHCKDILEAREGVPRPTVKRKKKKSS